MRFVRQVTAVTDENAAPDNYINPQNLSYLDNAMLKEVLKKIAQIQQQVKSNFLSTT